MRVRACLCVRTCVHVIWDRYFIQSLPNVIIFKPCVFTVLRMFCLAKAWHVERSMYCGFAGGCVPQEVLLSLMFLLYQ